MGFWHTGYIDFHQPSGIEDWCRPAPPTFRCTKCNLQFDNEAALRLHRFQAHPFKRPLLFIRGTEIGSTPLTITRAINPRDVDTGACSTAIVNGIKMSAKELAGTLASIEQDTVRIILEGDGTTASFEVRIEIASDEDMAGVEHVFFGMVRDGRLDMRAIMQFIQEANQFKSAAGYCDGICEYFYGVLAKERSPESSLRYDVYREKFTRALDKLRTFDRPIANRVAGLIEFHFNHFSEAVSFSPDSRVGYAAAAFCGWLAGVSQRKWKQGPIVKEVRIESLLTDWDTERLVRWVVEEPSTLEGDVAQMEKMLLGNIAEFDRTKLHILLAQIGLSLKNQRQVLSHARELRNSPSVAHWADAAIETSKDWGER